MEDLSTSAIIEVNAFGWFDESAVDGLWSVAAVEFPGWVACGCETGGFEDANVWVAVAVGWAPDLALGFAVAYGGSLSRSCRLW